MTRLTRREAISVLNTCGIAPNTDFHALSSSAIDALLSSANQHKYRRPKNANGSRARTYYKYVLRSLNHLPTETDVREMVAETYPHKDRSS